MPDPRAREARELSLEPGTRLEVRREGEAVLPLEVVRPLKAGGGHCTYLASAADGRLVVLKAGRWRDRSDAGLAIEERILAQLDHPNVVRYLGSGSVGTARRVIACERACANPLLILSRPDVRACFPDDPGTRFRPLPPPIALRLGRDLLRGLEHLHGRGFVHHDVKLANLMVRVSGSDVAEVPDHTVLERAMEGRAQGLLIDVEGSRSAEYLAALNRGEADDDLAVVPPQLTPLYAPPEALLPSATPCGRRRLLLPSLDLYAAACVVHACVTGRGPYDHLGGDARDPAELRRVKAREREGGVGPFAAGAVSATPGYGDLAHDIEALLAACTDPDPDRRPSVREARRRLQEVHVAATRAASEER